MYAKVTTLKFRSSLEAHLDSTDLVDKDLLRIQLVIVTSIPRFFGLTGVSGLEDGGPIQARRRSRRIGRLKHKWACSFSVEVQLDVLDARL